MNRYILLGVIVAIVIAYTTVSKDTTNTTTQGSQATQEQPKANELSRADSARKDTVDGLNGMKVIKDKGELSKAVENNSHASKLNGLSLE